MYNRIYTTHKKEVLIDIHFFILATTECPNYRYYYYSIYLKSKKPVN